jgi:hypothetical protein
VDWQKGNTKIRKKNTFHLNPTVKFRTTTATAKDRSS